MEKTGSKKKHIIRNIFLIVVLLLVVSGIIGLVYAGAKIYDSQFGTRIYTYEPTRLTAEMYDGLHCDECSFTSYQGTELAGYRIFSDKYGESFGSAAESAKAVVIIAHGMGGGGFNSYMDAAAWFADRNYVVFGYDATGNDNSDGDGMGGLPQGTEDVCAAVEYIQCDEDTADLGICLFGHSWGAYSVMNALNKHPEVKAVAGLSGWNSSKDTIYEIGKKQAGDAAMKIILPFMMKREKALYHEFSAYTAVDGFRNSDAGIVVVHSADDNTIRIEDGYDIFYREFGDDPRFTFIKYDDKGHDSVYRSRDAIEYIEQFNEKFRNDLGITDSTQTIDPDLKAGYIKDHIDLMRYSEVDEELFEQIDEVFTKYTK